MKLITAVIGKKDLNPVCDALREGIFIHEDPDLRRISAQQQHDSAHRR